MDCRDPAPDPVFFDVLEMTDTTVISTVITLRSTSQHSLEHHAQNPD